MCERWGLHIGEGDGVVSNRMGVKCGGVQWRSHGRTHFTFQGVSERGSRYSELCWSCELCTSVSVGDVLICDKVMRLS